MSQEISQSQAEVKAQAQVVENSRKQLRECENAMFLADQRLSKFVCEVEDATVALKVQSGLDKDRWATKACLISFYYCEVISPYPIQLLTHFIHRATRLAASEKTRAKRREVENSEALEARAAQFQELERVAQSQVAVARESSQKVNAQVKMTTAKTREVVERLEKYDAEEWEDRAEAVLELRTNQVAVRAKAATQSDKYTRKVKKQQKELEQQKEAMLAKGLNPYAEFRRREIDAADALKERRLLEAVEKNKAGLSERLIKEESAMRKAERAERKEKVCAHVCVCVFDLSLQQG